ncbi:hypothetical protein [Lamprocystis purpurea]|jgi:hypothetical protein|uniref:hypothetical protein n=1 Tax=Lamprocystis purpurea TaxID=61598 RepID=UPI00037AD4FE|nr:hypothetical protein [Lamprocystis purpurea]
MTADVDNLVLEHLRLLRSDIKEMRTEMQSGFHDLKDRMARLETAMLRVKRDALGAEESVAFQQVAHDRLVERIERIERRLELSDS